MFFFALMGTWRVSSAFSSHCFTSSVDPMICFPLDWICQGYALRLHLAISGKHVASCVSFHFSLGVITFKNILYLILSFELFKPTYWWYFCVLTMFIQSLSIKYLVVLFVDIIRFIWSKNWGFVIFESLLSVFAVSWYIISNINLIILQLFPFVVNEGPKLKLFACFISVYA